MKLNKLIFSSIILYSFFYCNLGCFEIVDNKERNEIFLKNSIETVKFSMYRISILLDKSKVDSSQLKNYFFDLNDTLYINSVNRDNINYNKIINGLSKIETLELKNLILKLKQNKITGTYKEPICNCFLFDYRPLSTMTYNQVRYIYIYDSIKNYNAFFISRKKLDSINNLYLIGT